jgi:hypothetical protein
MSTGFYIPFPDVLAERLSELPEDLKRTAVEQAVHTALDSEGWPRGERGTINVHAAYWYVVLFKHGELRGHVGPITDEQGARRTAASWREGGLRATVSRRPVGPALTNNY